MKKLLMLVVAAFALSSATAQLNPAQPIPMDPQIRTGKLENGMTYYIRHNEKPKGQASFYILHNVGAIQEADNQQGLAHFLEHMAFNGTKNLPGKTMINYLEKIGVKFGANLNAGTSWDLTQYEINDVPTVRQGVIDTAMLILHDWSHFIALAPEEVNAERGVISEELRTRDGAQFRSTNKTIAALGKGTLYEKRNIIGSLEGLRSFSFDDICTFYNTWYRPDYQAIAIVGDIDVDKIEAQLKSLMSDIPAASADAPQKEVIVVPDNEQPIVSIFSDPEMTRTDATLYIKRMAIPVQYNNTVGRNMSDLMTQLMSSMINSRFEEIAMQPNAPFLSASLYDGPIGVVPTLESTIVSVTTEDGKLTTGFESVLTELEKVRRFGFTDGEFARAKEILMRTAERQYANRNDRRNGEFVTRMLESYKRNASMPDAETEWQLDSTLLNVLALEHINMVSQQLIQPNNWVLTVNEPKKDGLVNVTEEELLGIIAKVKASEIVAHQDNTVKEPLIANLAALKGSAVKQTTTNAVLGTTEWTLKNGAKIIVKPTTFKADEVMMTAKSNGGSSLVSDKEYYTAMLMPNIMSMMGTDKFSSTDLRKQLAGKTASANISVESHEHGIQGYASPRDVETMLQLMYLNFTAPRFNEADYNTFMNQVRSQVENMLKNPDYIAQDKMMETLYNNNPRAQLLSTEIINSIKFESMKSIHDKLYNGVNNFTFTFVGNVDLKTLKPLVEKYIGSIPTSKTKLNFVDDKILTVKGEVVNDFRTEMQQPKVSMKFIYTGETPYTIENRMNMTVLTQVLSSRYLVSIREEKGGTYGVGVQGKSDHSPREEYAMFITFDTNEQMADELGEIVIAEIKKIANEGPKSEDVEKVREYLAKSWQNSLVENGAWVEYLDRYYTNGIDYISTYDTVLKNLTNDDVQKFAQKILADGNLVRIVMRPEVAKAE